MLTAIANPGFESPAIEGFLYAGVLMLPVVIVFVIGWVLIARSPDKALSDKVGVPLLGAGIAASVALGAFLLPAIGPGHAAEVRTWLSTEYDISVSQAQAVNLLDGELVKLKRDGIITPIAFVRDGNDIVPVFATPVVR